MARAETMSALDRPGQRGRHHGCRMEAPQPYAWPGSTGTGQQQPSTPPCAQREETAPPPPGAHPRDTSMAESTDSDREDQQSRRRGAALPDLLTEREPPLQASQSHRAPGGGGREAPQVEEEVLRVATQLRMIADNMNATILRRAQGAPLWQDWRGVCRGLLTFISDTLSVLYRLT